MADDVGICSAGETWSLSGLLIYPSGFFAFLSLTWITLYVLAEIFMTLRPVPDLKKKYDATWALVTGGGSGIGKSLCFKLASQGLNVVIVSLDDDFLKDTTKELKKAYPDLEFRSVACNFSPGQPYMEKIIEATKDITVQCIFNNAGFIVTGFLDQSPIGKILANIECNATASVNVTHHFLSKLVTLKKKGCIVFTSSVAAYTPTPFASMYASTKAFISQFAASINIEVSNLGIDVCAVHPSPVASNFYANVEHKIDLMEAAQKQAVAPDNLPDEIFKSVGACPYRDIGGMAIGTRMGTFFLPYYFMSMMFAFAAPLLPDYKTHSKNRK